jgi:hypothetical protein
MKGWRRGSAAMAQKDALKFWTDTHTGRLLIAISTGLIVAILSFILRRQ